MNTINEATTVVVTTMDSSENSIDTSNLNVVSVPITAFNTCEDRIKHLSCLKTIMTPSATKIHVHPGLNVDLCDYILKELNVVEADHAHVDVCLQVGDNVGGMIYLSNNEESSDSGKLFSTVKVNEIDKVLSFVDDISNTKVVDRSVIITTSVYSPKSKEAEKLRAKNDNKGNYIWAFGASRLFNPFTTVNVKRNVTPTAKEDPLDMFGDDPKVYVVATANLFDMNGSMHNSNQGMDAYDNKIRSKIDQFRLPTIMLGAGVQAEFTEMQDTKEHPFHDIVPTSPSLDQYLQNAHLELHDAHKQILSDIQQHTVGTHSVSVRGRLTHSACMNGGYNICIPLGCPSLTINRSLNLGHDLSVKWEKTIAKLQRGEKIRVGITLPADGPTATEHTHENIHHLISTFQKINDSNNDVFFILQTRNDRVIASKIADESNIKSFLHVEDWMEFTGDLDVLISSRIHGGMAGIIAGTPSIIIPTDLRIMELVYAMKLPTLDLDKIVDADSQDLLSLLQLVQPDFEAFERNRREKISKYLGILTAYNLEMDPGLLAILNRDEMYTNLVSTM